MASVTPCRKMIALIYPSEMVHNVAGIIYSKLLNNRFPWKSCDWSLKIENVTLWPVTIKLI